MLFAYVFGSTDTEAQNPQSDLDIAVYLDLEPDLIDLEHKLAIYAETSRAINRNDIDVEVLNTCINQMLLYEIMTKGRLIFDADPEFRALFEQKTLHAAIDFKAYRERIFA